MTVGGALGNRPLGSLPGATAGASLIAHAGSPGDAPKLQHPTLEEDTGGVLQTVAAGRTGGAGGEVLVRICHGAISCRGGGGGGAANPWLPGGGGGGGMEFGAPCACPGSRLREPTPCAVHAATAGSTASPWCLLNSRLRPIFRWPGRWGACVPNSLPVTRGLPCSCLVARDGHQPTQPPRPNPKGGQWEVVQG